ncbi:MAG TPA: alpha-L-fucosidase [Bryobacteraceae bacterium]|nr:alpha-L-fucosidase [Bryobacteraceae bacterium]
MMLIRCFFIGWSMAAVSAAQNFTDLKPSPQQVAWQDMEIGALIHFGPNTFMDREWGDGHADPQVFNPAELDAAQWVAAAKSAGARYVVLVAKHHDGFCLWPTRQTPYSVKASPWRNGHGDLVREVAAAAHKQGLRFGIYLSPWDRHDPRYTNNAEYDNYYRAEMTELLTLYGEIAEFWLDGAGSEGHVYDFDSYMRTLRTYQPNTLIFADVGFLKYGDIRWVGNESGFAPEEDWNVVDRLGYLRWRPAEADTPLRTDHWFWHPNDEKSLKTLAQLMETYHKTVGRGAQLMIGLAPDRRGLLPESDAARLKEFGDEVRRVYGADEPPETWMSSAPLEIRSATPLTFDRAVMMEQLNYGQQVERYIVEAWDGRQWKTLAAGTTIGHKKIDIFPRTSARRVRLRIVESAGAPRIRQFRLCDGSAR